MPQAHLRQGRNLVATAVEILRPRPVRLIVAGGALLAVAIAVATGMFVRDLYDQAIRDTEQSLISLSTVLADQADRALQALEVVQEAIIKEIRTGGAADVASLAAQVSNRATHEALKVRTVALPQVNAVTIVDATGKLLNFTRYWPIPDVNIADRDYFKALSTDPTLKRFISMPVQNRGDGMWTIYLARRISAPDGTFLGLVLGAVELGYFTNLYGQIAPQPDYVISLFRTDGILLVRHPHREGTIGLGFAKAGAPRIAVTNPSGGVLRNVSPIDGQDRLVATRTLANYPAIQSVSRTAEACLAPWRRQAVVLGLAALLLDLGLFGLIFLGVRRVHGQARLVRAEAARAAAEERERGERELRTQYAQFGIALDSMVQGLCLFDAGNRLIVMNARYAQMHSVPPALARPGTTLAAIRAHLATRDGNRLPPWTTQVAVRPMATIWDLSDGRAIAVVHAPTPDGGWLCTHEDVTERRRSEAQIIHMARHDLLTGLPNRGLLRERLAQVLATRQPHETAAVLYLDLDGFKLVNDTFGHPAGDALLCLVAERLRLCMRTTDFVARLGGDEFAVVQFMTDPGEGSAALAARIVEALQAPFDLLGQEIVIGTSIGIATIDGSGEATGDTVLRQADVALYQAKAAGRGTWRFFEPAMDMQLQRRHHLGLDLRRALAGEQFALHYQPLVEAGTRTVTGFEALLRWHHPEHGDVSPAEFIPIAEETGLIRPIGAWVLAQACRDAVAWPAAIRVAVNLSAVQFARNDLVVEVTRALAESGLAPHRLELEITESVLLQDDAATFEILPRLRSLGLHIAMDDFGTGYSSVNYLCRFPFDKLKIDQCFIRPLGMTSGSVAIVRAMIGLGKALDMCVVAEGVETMEQAALLQAEGCDELQGFLFSRPLPAGEISAFLARNADGVVPPVAEARRIGHAMQNAARRTAA